MRKTIMGLVRHLLTFGGGFVVAKGWVDQGTSVELVGALVTVIGGAWSVIDKMGSEPVT